MRLFADAVAPGLLVAQGIGRLGNWFNQELFGKPTNLPWGLKIDERHRPAQYVTSDTFHPTFLYELIYDLGMAGVLILVGRRFRSSRRGCSPCTCRSTASAVRSRSCSGSTRRTTSLGQRLNFWVSIVVFACSTAFFVWWQFFHTGGERPAVKRRREPPRGPAMAVPKGRVRPRR